MARLEQEVAQLRHELAQRPGWEDLAAPRRLPAQWQRELQRVRQATAQTQQLDAQRMDELAQGRAQLAQRDAHMREKKARTARLSLQMEKLNGLLL